MTPASQVDESVLVSVVDRARQGSSEAFEELVAEFGPRLFRLLVLRLRSFDDAHDVLQETLCAAWMDLPRLRDQRKVGSWLAGIAVNKARTASRRRAGTPPSDLADLDGTDPAIGTAALELKAALSEIPEVFREVLLMRYLLGLSERETARALGVRIGTVKSRTSRARTAMIDALGGRTSATPNTRTDGGSDA